MQKARNNDISLLRVDMFLHCVFRRKGMTDWANMQMNSAFCSDFPMDFSVIAERMLGAGDKDDRD